MKSFEELFADLDLSGPSDDYTQDFNASTVFKDTRFLNDVRQFFEAKGETFADDQEMLAAWYNDRSWGNLNTLGMAEDLKDAHLGAPEQRARLKRLQFVYDNMPNFWEDGGAVDQVGKWEVAKSIGGAVLADPVNLLGPIGAYGKAARASAAGAKTGKALWEGVKAGAKTEALVNAPIEAGFDVALQNRDIELGLQDEYSKTQTAMAGVAGGVLGGGMGALGGLATSIFARKNIQLGKQVYQDMVNAGITEDHINRMTDSQLDQLLDRYAAKSASAQDKAEGIKIVEAEQTRIDEAQTDQANRAAQASQPQQDSQEFQPDPDLQRVLDHLIQRRDDFPRGSDERKAINDNITNVRRVIRETNNLEVRNKAVEDQYKKDPYNRYANQNERNYTEREDFVNELKRSVMEDDYDNLDQLLKQDEALSAERAKQKEAAKVAEAAQPEAQPQAQQPEATPATKEQQPAQEPVASEATPEPEPAVDPSLQKKVTAIQTQWEEVMDEPLDVDLTDKDKAVSYIQSAKESLDRAKADTKQIKADPKNKPVVGPKARAYLKTKMGMTDDKIDSHRRPKALLTKLAEHRGLTLPKAARDMSREQMSAMAELSPRQLKSWQEDVVQWADAVTEHAPSGKKELRQQIWKAIFDAKGRGDDADTFVDISYMATPNKPDIKTKGRGAVTPDKAPADDSWKGQRSRNIGGGLYVEPKYARDLSGAKLLTKEGLPNGVDYARILHKSQASLKRDGLFIPFKSRGKTHVVDGVPLRHGEVGYLDPNENKVFRSKDSYYNDVYERTLREGERQPLTLNSANEVIRRQFMNDLKLYRAGEMDAVEIEDFYGEIDSFDFTSTLVNLADNPKRGKHFGFTEAQVKQLVRANTVQGEEGVSYRSDELFDELSIGDLERGLDGRKPAEISDEATLQKAEAEAQEIEPELATNDPEPAAKIEEELPEPAVPESPSQAIQQFLEGDTDAIRRYVEASQNKTPEPASEEPGKLSLKLPEEDPAPEYSIAEGAPVSAGDFTDPGPGFRRAIKRTYTNRAGVTVTEIRVHGKEAQGAGADESFSAMIGKSTERWERGIVAKDAGKYYSANPNDKGRLAEQSWIADSDTAHPRELDPVEDTKAQIAADKRSKDAPTPFEELGNIPLKKVNNRQLAAINFYRQQKGVPAIEKGQPVSVAQLVSARIVAQDSSTWQAFPSVREYGEALERFTSLVELEQKLLPNRYLLNPTSREQIRGDVNELFSGFAKQDIDSAYELLSRLADAHGQAPTVKVSGQDTKMAGEISNHFSRSDMVLKESSITVHNQKSTPASMTLMHEVGHWAFRHVLTPSDQLEFFRWFNRTYYKDGKLSYNKLVDDTIYSDLIKEDAGKINVTSKPEVFLSPDEIFSHQFNLWFARKLKGEGAVEVDKMDGYWKKLSRYFQAIFDRFWKGKPVQPDLEPLFAKIIPDHEAIAAKQSKALAIGKNNPEARLVDRAAYITTEEIEAINPKGTAKHSHRRLVELEDLDRQVIDNISRNQRTVADHEPFEQLANFFNSVSAKGNLLKYLRQVDQQRYSSGAFKVLSPLHEEMQGAAHQILRLTKRVRNASLDKADEYPFIDIADININEIDYDGLYRLWDEGNAKPEAGLSSPPLKELLPKVRGMLEWDLYSGTGIAVRDNTLITGNQYRSKSQYAEEVFNKLYDKSRKKYVDRAALDNKAIEDVTTQVKVNKKRSQKQGKNTGQSVKGISFDELRQIALDNRGTDWGEDAALELVKRINSQAPKPKNIPKKVRNDIFIAKKPELAKILRSAVEESDSSTIDQVLYRLYAKQHKVKQQRGGNDFRLLEPKDSRIRQAVADETEAFRGISPDTGIPANASAFVRQALSNMTHRDPEVQAALRTLSYRMYNLLGKTPQSFLENDTAILSVADIHKLAGKKPPANASATFADLSGAAFNQLRKDQRRFAIGLTKGVSDPVDLMHEIGHMTMRTIFDDADKTHLAKLFRESRDPIKQRITEKYGDQSFDQQVEEWFVEGAANYLAERVAKGDIWAYRTGSSGEKIRLRGRISTMVDRLIEALAYVTNGLIGNNNVKQYYRRLTFYGDMFGRPANPYGQRNKVPTAFAADYMASRMKDVDDIRIANMRQFARGTDGWDEAADQPVIFWHNVDNAGDDPVTSGVFGDAIYLTRNTDIARSKLGEAPTFERMKQRVRSLNLGDQENDALLMADDLADVRRQIARAARNLGDSNRPYLQTRLDALLESEAVIKQALLDQGVEFNTGISPSVVRATDLLNLRAGALVDADHPVLAVAETAVERGVITDAQLTTLREVARAEQPTGEQFLPLMNQMAEPSDWANIIRSKGYKGIAYTERFQKSEHTRSVAHDSLMMFDAENVRHFESDDFNGVADEAYDNIIPAANPNGGLMLAALESEGPMNAQGFANIASGLEKMGVPSKLVDGMSNIIRGRVTTKEGGEISKFRMPFQIARNSARWRRWNDSFLSDWLAPIDGQGHYERVGQHLGSTVIPIFRALKELPDAYGKLASWGASINPTKRRLQPRSYKKIVQAMRRKPGSGAEQSLSPAEFDVYMKLRNEFESIAGQMKDAGVMMGHIRENYYPQLWSKDRLEKDPDTFIDAMANYFMADSRKGNGDPLDWDAAKASASRMYDKLVNDDGMYIPTPGGARETRGDHIDFQRVIRLDQADEGTIKSLEPFLENDLESVITKYFDTATRRIDMTKKFGVGNHALYDYINMIEAPNLTTALADLLSSNKVHTRNIKVPLSSNEVGEMAIDTTLLNRPFNSNEKALPAAKEAREIFDRHGKEAAREFLIDVFGDQPSDTHLKRIDAVVHALDVRRNNHKIDASELGKALGVIQAVQHKPMTAGDPFNSQAMGFVRGLKAFNNITLLGYTTLTSFGDPALALIRSGDMKSFAKGMKKWATDPDYRHAIQNSGVAIENIVHQRLQYLYGGDATYASQAFFNASLLTPWTNTMREIAGSVAFEAVKAEQKRLNRFYKTGLPISEQPRQYKTAMRFLKRLGLDEFAQPGAQSLDSPEMLANEKVRGALIRFANESIFAPNPNDVPAWAQTPWGSLMFQFKSFPMQMGRLSRYAVEEAAKGNVKPALLFVSAGPGFAAASLSAKDIVQSRGGEDNQSTELRNRNILKSLGYDQDIHGDENDFLGWYYEAMLHMGGVGLLANMVYDIAQQTDNGAYGQMRVMGTVFGPSVSNVAAKSLNLMAGISDASDNSNAKERQAARETIGMVPFAGQNSYIKESFVDAVAGEKQERKKKDSGWGDSGWGKDGWD